VSEFDRLVAIARRADLIAAIVDLDGPYAERLKHEMHRYKETAGSAATNWGWAAHLRRLGPWALQQEFARDFQTLTGLPIE
jgi:hypothetical protein